MPLDPRDRRNKPTRGNGGRMRLRGPDDPRQLRNLVHARSHGRTRRPRGTGGNGPQNNEPGQWAQARFYGYKPSQLPPIDQGPPVDLGPKFAPLLNDAGVGCERSQYSVSVSAVETTLENFVATPILTRQDVLNQGVGLSQLQVLVQWSLGAGRDNQLVLDIGAGFLMSLPATRIQMALVIPESGINLDGREGQPVPIGPADPVTGNLETAWNQCLVWGEVSRTGTYSAIAEWQLTRGLFVPATQTVSVAIPQGADFVEVFETSNIAPATTFLNFVTDPAPVPLDVGQLSFLTNRPRSTGRVRIPGTAKAIQSGPPNATDARFFSVIFTMRP